MKEYEMLSGGVKDTEVEVREQPTFVNLTYDHGFKIVFGTEGKSEKLLMTMLNSVLGMKIAHLDYLPTERLGLTAEESESFFDVYCTDCNGRRFLLEMQMWSQHFFHKRAAYYCSLSVQDQVRREKKYQKEKCGRKNWNYYFQPVFVVSFLNFPNNIVDAKEDGGNPYISHYVYRTKDTGKELGDETNLIFIDLERFRKDFEECEDLRERWLYSIRNMHLFKECPEGIVGTELEDLYTESYFAGLTAEQRSFYERNAMNKNDYGNILEERYEDGVLAGLEKGLEQGREEARLMNARKMKELGMENAIIAQVTGLSVEEIEKY